MKKKSKEEIKKRWNKFTESESWDYGIIGRTFFNKPRKAFQVAYGLPQRRRGIKDLEKHERDLPKYIREIKELMKEDLKGRYVWWKSRELANEYIGKMEIAQMNLADDKFKKYADRYKKIQDTFIKLNKEIKLKQRDHDLRLAHNAINSGYYRDRDNYLERAREIQKQLRVYGKENAVFHEIVGDMYLKGESPNYEKAYHSYNVAFRGLEDRGDKEYKSKIKGKLDKVEGMRKKLEKKFESSKK